MPLLNLYDLKYSDQAIIWNQFVGHGKRPVLIDAVAIEIFALLVRIVLSLVFEAVSRRCDGSRILCSHVDCREFVFGIIHPNHGPLHVLFPEARSLSMI